MTCRQIAGQPWIYMIVRSGEEQAGQWIPGFNVNSWDTSEINARVIMRIYLKIAQYNFRVVIAHYCIAIQKVSSSITWRTPMTFLSWVNSFDRMP